MVTIAYRYCSASFENRGPWKTLKVPDALWSSLRQDLEHEGHDSAINRRTYLRGFLKEVDSFVELTAQARLERHQKIYLVRHSMPLGGRPFQPIQKNPTQLLLKEESDRLADDAYKWTLKEAMQTNWEPTEEDLKLKEAFEKREKIAFTIQRLKVWCGTHVSEMKRRVHCVSNQGAQCEQEDVEVPPTFKCFSCMALGHHHQSACFLQNYKRDEGPMWGTSKFKVQWNEDDEEAFDQDETLVPEIALDDT